jgi:hypothetical protein
VAKETEETPEVLGAAAEGATTLSVDTSDVVSVAKHIASLISVGGAKTDISEVAKCIAAHVDLELPATEVGPRVASLRGAVTEILGRKKYAVVVRIFKLALAAAETAPATVSGFTAFIQQTTDNYVTQGLAALGSFLKGRDMTEWVDQTDVSETLAVMIEAAWAQFLALHPVEGLSQE